MPDLTDLPRPTPELSSLSGTVLEQRYELGRVLGTGGMGAVFEARHLRLDRPVAIKILRPMFAGQGEYIARFLREAKAASKIRHRNVVDILDYGEAADGLAYSVMEFLVGQDLEQLLREQPDGRLPWSRVCELLVQISSGLNAAHGEGVIHRDVKPANCFLTEEDGEPLVKLLDFGIAKVEEAEHQLTATAQVLGTPCYIAPEQARTKQPANQQSDVYSFGVLCFRVLTGRLPFTGDTIFEVLRQTCFEPVPSLRERAPELPAAVESFVMELMAKDPRERPRDMQVVRERLLELGRRTLGPRAVVFAPSGALPLATGGDEVQASEPTPSGITARRGDEGEDVERTERLEDGPAASSLVRSREPTEELETRPATKRLLEEFPSRSGETLLAAASNELDIEGSGARDGGRSRRRGGLWVAIGGVLGVGVLAVAIPLVRDGQPAEMGSEEEEPIMVAADDVADEGEPVIAERRPVESTPSQSMEESRGSTTLEEDGLAEMADRSDVPAESTSESGALPAEPTPTPAPAPVSRAKRAQETRSKRSAVAEGPMSERPPPSDSSLIVRIRGQIESRCAKALEGGTVTVGFTVDEDGQVGELSASTEPPGTAAGSCAMVQVEGVRFRPRHERVRKKIVVQGS